MIRTKAKPIIVESNTDQVDLTSQYAAPAAYQFGQYIQMSSQAGLSYSITYTDRTQFGPRASDGVAAVRAPTPWLAAVSGIFEPEGTSGRVNRNILPFLLSETVNQTANVVPNRTFANFFSPAWVGYSKSIDPADSLLI